MRAPRLVSVAVGVSIVLGVTACGNDSGGNNASNNSTITQWNNVFYQNGAYYCVYPFGARELCQQATDPDGNAIPEANWVQAQDPGNYNPDSTSLSSVAWGVFLLNIDWYDDVIDEIFDAHKKKSLHSKLKKSKSMYKADLNKIGSRHWTPPASPAAPKSKTPKGDKNKGTKDCAFGTVNSGVELAAYPALTNGGSSGNRNATNGGTGNQNNTNGGNANGGNANGSVSSGQTGGTGTEKLPDNNQQQPRNNGC